MDSATLSPMLKRLEGLGLITRSRSVPPTSAPLMSSSPERGTALRGHALKVPPAVVERLGVDLAELEDLHQVLTRINTAALAAGALQS